MERERVYYAIGDVHGMASRLGALHNAILSDADSKNYHAVMVHLGDYIDRGPDSRGVIERIRAMESFSEVTGQFDVVSLRGNHEQMMLDAISRTRDNARSHWESNGGEATIKSYRRSQVGAGPLVDLAHVRWLKTLPTLYQASERRFVFVHAGIDPYMFPGCSDEVRMWTRSRDFFADQAWPGRAALEGVVVVHGHTPTTTGVPEVSYRRINVDTGAVYGGPLSCVVLRGDDDPRFLYA